jgi:glycosyltransferase involved in cell wall biosynthesis
MQNVSQIRRVWSRDVDLFISLTDNGSKLFELGGVPKSKIRVKPNFVSLDDAPVFQSFGDGSILFAGRISGEKGIISLLEAWHCIPDIQLIVVGDGPLLSEARARAPENVKFLGSLERSQVLDHMSRSSALVFPSIWYEGFPMILAEAMASGLPIVSSQLGAASEIVDESFGEFFRPGDANEIVGAVRRLWARSSSQLRLAARAKFEALYTDAINIALLEKIYSEAIEIRHFPRS